MISRLLPPTLRPPLFPSRQPPALRPSLLLSPSPRLHLLALPHHLPPVNHRPSPAGPSRAAAAVDLRRPGPHHVTSPPAPPSSCIRSVEPRPLAGSTSDPLRPGFTGQSGLCLAEPAAAAETPVSPLPWHPPVLSPWPAFVPCLLRPHYVHPDSWTFRYIQSWVTKWCCVQLLRRLVVL